VPGDYSTFNAAEHVASQTTAHIYGNLKGGVMVDSPVGLLLLMAIQPQITQILFASPPLSPPSSLSSAATRTGR